VDTFRTFSLSPRPFGWPVSPRLIGKLSACVALWLIQGSWQPFDETGSRSYAGAAHLEPADSFHGSPRQSILFPMAFRGCAALWRALLAPAKGIAIAWGLVLMIACSDFASTSTPSPPHGSQPTAASEAPTTPPARFGAVMAYDVGKYQDLLFGGLDAKGSYLSDVWLWNADRGWSKQVQGPQARAFAAAAPDGQGYVLLFGGDTAQGPLADTWLWNQGWREVKPKNSPPGGVSRAMTLEGRVAAPLLVVFGADRTVTTWRWNNITDDWDRLNPPQTPTWRLHSALALDQNTNEVILFGGTNFSGAPLSDTWSWDSTSWRLLTPAHTPPGGPPSMAYTGRGPLLLSAGTTWLWDGSDWSPQTAPPLPPSYANSAMAGYPSIGRSGGGALVFGGRDPATGGIDNRSWVWDGKTWIFQSR
jgi:Galactose oxidase, central domain